METIDFYLYDEVYGGEAEELAQLIKANPEAKHINVHISSPGGYVYEGWTIGNIIANSNLTSTALIEGFCASIATFIALSCNKVLMSETSQFMIHNASSFVGGNASEMKKQVALLESIDSQLINKYLKKSNLSKEQIKELMDQEKFMTAEEAIKFGFVDGYMEKLKAVARFDMSKKEETPNDGVKTLTETFKRMFNILKNESEPKEPKNMVMTLEDGTQVFVESEDGEFEGKRIFLVEDGAVTETPAPDGVHKLQDGRQITVEGGVIQSVSEAENIDEEKEEMKEKIETLEEQLKEKAKAHQKIEAKLKEQSAKLDEHESKFLNLANEVKNFASISFGEDFKIDASGVTPKVKAKLQNRQPHNLDEFTERLKRKFK